MKFLALLFLLVSGGLVSDGFVSGGALAQPAPRSLDSPVGGGCVSSPFGPRGPILLASTGANLGFDLPEGFHSGVDIKVPLGTPIRAVAYGHVVFVGVKGPYGLTVDVEHAAYTSRYAHLAMVSPDIAAGRRLVGPDTVLGRVGMTGVTTGPHVHFEIRVKDQAINPAKYVLVSACR